MLLRLSEVAERLKCSISNVHNLKDAGKLAVISTGASGKGYRVELEELERFIAQQRVEIVRQIPPFPKKSDPGPVNSPRPFENLDGDRLFAAWQKQGVISGRPNEDNAPSA